MKNFEQNETGIEILKNDNLKNELTVAELNKLITQKDNEICLMQYKIEEQKNIINYLASRAGEAEMNLNKIRGSISFKIINGLKNKFRGNKLARKLLGLSIRVKDKLKREYWIYKIKNSEYFDAKYYKEVNNLPDNTKLAKHFYYTGAFEGRNPSEKFDTSYYLMSNHDVMLHQLNPLVHYIRSGKAEGRKISCVGSTDNTFKITEADNLFSEKTVAIIGDLNLQQCKKYRVAQKQEILESLGYNCEISHCDDSIRSLSLLQVANIVIFYRMPKNHLFDNYLREIKRLGITKVFYDIDDPIFSKEIYSANTSLDSLSNYEKNQLLGSTDLYLNAMKEVDNLILSTNYLGNEANKILNKNYFVWENFIDEELLSAIDMDYRKDDSDDVVIGYMSGSRAHDYDFKMAESGLLKILEQYPNTKLLVGGHAKLSKAFDEFEKTSRILRFEFADYKTYISKLQNVDINLVPLEDNVFNECKSSIRYFEASLCKIPSVCTLVGQFEEAITTDKNGLLVNENNNWFEQIEKLVVDKNLRTQMGEEAYKNVMENHCVKTLNKEELCSKLWR